MKLSSKRFKRLKLPVLPSTIDITLLSRVSLLKFLMKLLVPCLSEVPISTVSKPMVKLPLKDKLSSALKYSTHKFCKFFYWDFVNNPPIMSIPFLIFFFGSQQQKIIIIKKSVYEIKISFETRISLLRIHDEINVPNTI